VGGHPTDNVILVVHDKHRRMAFIRSTGVAMLLILPLRSNERESSGTRPPAEVAVAHVRWGHHRTCRPSTLCARGEGRWLLGLSLHAYSSGSRR